MRAYLRDRTGATADTGSVPRSSGATAEEAADRANRALQFGSTGNVQHFEPATARTPFSVPLLSSEEPQLDSEMRKTLGFAIALVPSLGASAEAQVPAPSVSLSFGVDTSVTEVRDIVRLTRAYLARPDSATRACGLWSRKTPFDARLGDIATDAYQGFPATILGVSGTGPGDSVFVVKILHATADSSRKQISALALQRIFAVRAPGSPYGWQLASPLPRLTRDWVKRDVGPLTFWYAPGQRPSPSRAQLASRFVDSVAKVFSVPRPNHLDVYITGSTDESWRAVGLDFFPDGSGPGTGLGGRTLALAGILLLGDPAVGEAYLHEFVHAVLQPSLRGGTAIFNEGVAVWLGGSHLNTPRMMYALLRKYQLSHPEVTMRQVLDGDAPSGEAATTALYATSGLIVEAIYQRSGIPGLRRFATVRGSPENVIAVLPQYVSDLKPANVDGWWRTETEAAINRAPAQLHFGIGVLR
jgi:hypothetical protein